jgi:hypothetical protein
LVVLEEVLGLLEEVLGLLEEVLGLLEEVWGLLVVLGVSEIRTESLK